MITPFPQPSTRLVAMAALVMMAMVACIGHSADAQLVSSPACNTCLQNQLQLIPVCNGIQLSNTTVQATPEFKTCLCTSSFDFNWTSPCSITNCSVSDLSGFTSGYPAFIAALNLTCIKPTPTTTTSAPAPTSAASSAWTQSSMAILLLLAVVGMLSV